MNKLIKLSICHAERSEASHALSTEMLRYPQHDRTVPYLHVHPTLPFSSIPRLVILSAAKDLVPHAYTHPPSHSTLKSRHSGLIDSIKATFFVRNQPFRCFSRAIAAYTSDISSK